MIKFSIITVCLNSEKTIERCLISVKNQTYLNYEHLIIDGLSNDNTVKIVQKYNVKYISEKDDGIYYAMNKGLKLAKGKFVIFLNSDDLLHDNYLEEVNKVCDKYDFVSVGVNLIYPTKQIKWLTNFKIILQKVFWNMPFPHPGLAVRREIMKDIGGFNTEFRLAADYNFILKMLSVTRNGFFFNQVLVDFFAGGQSHNLAIIKENYFVRKSNFGFSISLFIYLIRDLIRYFRGSLLG